MEQKTEQKEQTQEAQDTKQFSEKLPGATSILNKYIWWSMGAGLLPVPMLDMAVLTAAQLKMLHDISKHYEIEFSENIGKSIVATLVGTVTVDYAAKSTMNSWLKTIPVIGIIGHLSVPVYSGAMSYAIGKIFIQHFESGGTFLDFDPDKVKEYFAKLFRQGKNIASNLAESKE